MVTWSVVRTRSSHLCPVRSPFVSLLLRALGVVELGPGRVPGLFILLAGGLVVHLEVDDNFCFSLQVVFRYSRLRVFRSMCAAGRRSHTFTRCLYVRLSTLARVLSCSLDVVVLMCFLREVVFPLFSYACLNRYTHRRAGRELGGGSCRLMYLTPYVNAVSESRWYEFREDSCEDTDEEEGHCIAGQITDPTAIANTPGLRAEGRRPWHRSLVAFLPWRGWSDKRLVRVAFVLGPLLFFPFFSGDFFEQVSR